MDKTNISFLVFSRLYNQIRLCVPKLQLGNERIKTMKEFSAIVDPQFEKIRENKKQTQTLENLRDALLPKLLSGEVKVRHGS